MSSPSVEKAFCTTTEAARLLGISVATAQLWAETGLLSAWKTDGGHRRILRESVERHLYRNSMPAELQADTPSMTPPTAPQAPFARTLRVMVVEDDATLLNLYELQIQAWSVPVQLQLFDNAFSALLKIGRNPPDLLVVDLNMPDMDGFAMLRKLRRAPETQNTRMVVISGLDAETIAWRGGIPQGIEVLPKPVPFQRLESIGLEVLQQHSAATPSPSF